VTETGTAASKTIQVNISEDPVNLKGHGNRAVKIDFDIDPASTPGWTFSDVDGIVIHDPANFDNNGHSSGHKRHTWTRKGGQVNKGFVKYSISVTNGTTTVIVDPAINNEE